MCAFGGEVCVVTHTIKLSPIHKQRIVFFHHEGPTDCSNGKCPPGFHYWFQYASETQFSFDSVGDLKNYGRSCAITRGGSAVDFFAVNAFTTPASELDARTINQYAFLNNHVDTCSNINGGRMVNFVSQDYWSIGDGPKVVQDKNKALIAANGS